MGGSGHDLLHLSTVSRVSERKLDSLILTIHEDQGLTPKNIRTGDQHYLDGESRLTSSARLSGGGESALYEKTYMVGMDGSVDTNPAPEWLAAITDPELHRELQQNIAPHDFTGAIRAAFVLLERRTRESAGLEEYLHGKDLIDRAFHPENGILQPISPVGSERAGLHSLLVGVFLYYRNPIAHRSVYHSPESAFQILSLIDHALHLVRQAVELSFNLDNLVGPHEGQIWRRRDYRLDIDSDGELEVVILLELGPVMEEGRLAPHLLPIILKKDSKGYQRIPTEWVQGMSIHGPVSVKLRHLTNPNQPDVVVSWLWGETQSLDLILRRHDDRYVLAEREIPPGTKNPYSGPAKKGFLIHFSQMLNFADVDGDGLIEMVQTLSFDSDDLREMGYAERSETAGEYLLLSRLWKWDAEKQLIVLVEERLIARRDAPPHLA